MLNYIGKRLLSVIVTLFILSIVVFSLTHIMNGDPALAMLGSDASSEQVEELREDMGLNEPLIVQYISWVSDAVQGDLGDSYFRHQTVVESIKENLGPTIELSVFAQLIAMAIGIPLGVVAAKKKGSAVDVGASTAALLGMSIPSFLLGMLLILFFAVNLRILPVSGYAEISKKGLAENLRYMVIPAVTMGLIQSALIMRITRSTFMDVLNMDYIKTAKAKGVKQKKILWKHVFRNAAATILTVLGQSFGSLLAGVAVLETMYNIPGIGMLVVDSVLKRDYPVIQGIVLFISLIYVVINLLIDLSYGFIDPRIRITGSSK